MCDYQNDHSRTDESAFIWICVPACVNESFGGSVQLRYIGRSIKPGFLFKQFVQGFNGKMYMLVTPKINRIAVFGSLMM